MKGNDLVIENLLKIKRRESVDVHVTEECEIFCFPTEQHRADFIADLKTFGSVPHATNIDPDESEKERWLVAVPIRCYDTFKRDVNQFLNTPEGVS
jgi:hypothetical protein